MVFPQEEWEYSLPGDQGLDTRKMESALRYLAEKADDIGTDRAILIRNGYMIWCGKEAGKLQRIWSVSKTFTSTVLGVLVTLGKCKMETPVMEYISRLSEWYPELTFRHLTTMTSGYKAEGFEKSGSKTPLAIAVPEFKPGEVYFYNNDGMHLLAYALTKVAGQPMEEVFRYLVADIIGMKNWKWGQLETVDGLLVNGGTDNLGTGISTTAVDMARLGHLFLNKGSWNGTQVIHRDWVEEATKVQVPLGVRNIPYKNKTDFSGSGVYGFNLWINGITEGGTRYIPNAPPKTFFASGAHHNKCFVIPEWDMVFVRLGTGHSLEGTGVYNTFFGMLHEAIKC